jgi:hypothetical protein
LISFPRSSAGHSLALVIGSEQTVVNGGLLAASNRQQSLAVDNGPVILGA